MAEDVGWEMEQGSICGLGMVAAKPLETARQHFPEPSPPPAVRPARRPDEGEHERDHRRRHSLELNGRWNGPRGETVVEVAPREGIDIPTLCHDPRLEPAGACRVCLVEVEGQRRMQPGCAWRVAPGMKVTTESDRIERHRRVLYGLYLADHRLDDDGLPVETANANQLRALAEKTPPLRSATRWTLRGAAATATSTPTSTSTRSSASSAPAARATATRSKPVNAITLAWRGERDHHLHRRRARPARHDLRAVRRLHRHLSHRRADREESAQLSCRRQTKVHTHTCNFCGVGCQLDLHSPTTESSRSAGPPPGETVNDGNLCVKGRFAYDFIHHEDRLTEPLIRGEDGELHARQAGTRRSTARPDGLTRGESDTAPTRWASSPPAAARSKRTT